MSNPTTVTLVDRPELELTRTLKGQNQLRLLTPCWQAGAFAVQSAPGRWLWRRVVPLARYRQAPVSLAAVVLMGIPPFAVFAVWMTHRVDQVATPDLQWRMWVAGLWIIASPALITEWERRFVVLHGLIVATAHEEGWRLDRLVDVDRIFARLWWLFIGFMGLAIPLGFIVSREFFRTNTGTGDPSDLYFWVGLTIVTMLGIAFGVGCWGLAKTLVYARIVLDQPFAWNPFLSRQNDRIENLLSFSYWTGLLYSLGSV